MLKKLAFALALLASTSVFAAENNYVWMRASNGILEPICRKLWNDYDNYFHSTTTIMPARPGLDGILSMNDLLASKEHRKMFCGATSNFVLNPIIHKDIDTKVDDFEPLVEMAYNPIILYVPNSNAATSVKDSIAHWKTLNRPINVGLYFPTAEVVTRALAKEHDLNINIVRFKIGQQMYPSLADGSLDLMLDSPAGMQVAQTGKFKMLAYQSGYLNYKLGDYQNIGNESNDLGRIRSGLLIAIPKTYSLKERDILLQRLEFLIKRPEWQQYLAGFKAINTATTGLEYHKAMERERKINERYLK